MTVRAFTIGSATYNVAQASAVEQKSLMLLVGGVVAMRASTSGVEKIDTKLLFGVLMVMPEDKFDRIASIVLSKAFIAGGNISVDAGSFHGKMSEYFQLIAELIAYNLDDFFTYLDADRAVAQTANKAKTIQR